MKANGLNIQDSDSDSDAARNANDDEEQEEEEEEEEEGTGVMTSQLRHFVIQEYVPRPVLFDIGQTPNDPESALSGYKVTLRILLSSRRIKLTLVPPPSLCPIDGSLHGSPVPHHACLVLWIPLYPPYLLRR